METCWVRTFSEVVMRKSSHILWFHGRMSFVILGDCVYLAPDYAKQGPESAPVHTQPVAAVLGDRDDLPIFRVEKLWKDSR